METSSNVLCELFATMIKEPFFSTLRTKEQLGLFYIVKYCRFNVELSHIYTKRLFNVA